MCHASFSASQLFTHVFYVLLWFSTCQFCPYPSRFPHWHRCTLTIAKYCWCNPGGNEAWWRHQMETFSALLALCEGFPPVTSGFPLTKASEAELWYSLWSTPEQKVEKTIEAPVIWDAIALIIVYANYVRTPLHLLYQLKYVSPVVVVIVIVGTCKWFVTSYMLSRDKRVVRNRFPRLLFTIFYANLRVQEQSTNMTSQF